MMHVYGSAIYTVCTVHAFPYIVHVHTCKYIRRALAYDYYIIYIRSSTNVY